MNSDGIWLVCRMKASEGNSLLSICLTKGIPCYSPLLFLVVKTRHRRRPVTKVVMAYPGYVFIKKEAYDTPLLRDPKWHIRPMSGSNGKDAIVYDLDIDTMKVDEDEWKKTVYHGRKKAFVSGDRVIINSGIMKGQYCVVQSFDSKNRECTVLLEKTSAVFKFNTFLLQAIGA